MPTLRSYKFDVGNSYKGAVGMVLRVWARNRQEAVERANRFLGAKGKMEVAKADFHTGIEYCTVYFGANLKIRNVASGEEIEEVSSELAAAISQASDD